MDWRPIDSAPRDGTRILLWGSCHTSGANVEDLPFQVIVGRCGKIGRYAEYSSEWEADPADYYSVEIRPTHWMPLPDPPNAKALPT